MREITDHKLNGLNDALTITVLDEPGHGGACHQYVVHERKDAGDGTLPLPVTEIHLAQGILPTNKIFAEIGFQNGPIKEHGVNGISGEALLAIVIDRLRCFQEGEYKCRDNAIALTHLEDALMRLQKRTRDRLARGVEGTNVK